MSNTTIPKPTIGDLTLSACRILPANYLRLTDPGNTTRHNVAHRYMVFKLLDKAGHTHQAIADKFKVQRETVTRGIAKIEDWMGVYPDMKGTYQRLEILALNTL